MIEEGPMKEHIERSKEGVVVAKYITYTVKDGMLVKEVSTRKYMKSSRGDYIDSTSSEPIVEVGNET
tara:strand:- start:1084 stop:1284 length:201 start_codon:yes stop_codon:yes gene_type:complete